MYVYGRVLEHWVGYYYIREYGVVFMLLLLGWEQQQQQQTRPDQTESEQWLLAVIYSVRD